MGPIPGGRGVGWGGALGWLRFAWDETSESAPPSLSSVILPLARRGPFFGFKQVGGTPGYMGGDRGA